MDNKTKQICHQAYFKGVCAILAGSSLSVTDAFDEATRLVEKLDKLYKDEEVPYVSMTPAKTYPSAPKTADQYQGNDVTGSLCPMCGVGIMERKSGTSKKTGKPYSMVACNNYPACRYVQK